ncbi:SGNH/GDSL hydrolase family protein [uncultured Gilvimarinus sp.]|uniref:SGNH/GDSL hydrolase family protein n=1 Tax=uncultured Gilvimarinus sp. TaxID=1689143 RepID=UPI0030EDF1C3|tara:strand:+ start:1209 stop:2279 length:1071 start_codon:yes stop_codon:yes gene_type:complete
MLKTIIATLALCSVVACTPASGKLTPAATLQTEQGFSGESVTLVGRFDQRTDGRAAFTWPGTSMAFRFKGSSAAIRLASTADIRFLVEVDGEQSELWVKAGEDDYVLASRLDDKPHHVRLTRLAESFSGVTALASDPVTDGKLLNPPAPSSRRLLVIGDSITAGYGVEGTNKSCSYSQATSSPVLAYAGVAARQLNADIHTIAWSGIGVWRSYGEDTPQAPSIAERRLLTLGDDFDSEWDVSRYRPDAIIIAIGTNDFWQGSAPGYRAAMGEFVSQVQIDYPERPIYLMVSPMLSGDARAAQQADLEAIASGQVEVVDLGKIEPDDGYGCDYHPNVVTQKRLADKLVKILNSDLGW